MVIDAFSVASIQPKHHPSGEDQTTFKSMIQTVESCNLILAYNLEGIPRTPKSKLPPSSPSRRSTNSNITTSKLPISILNYDPVTPQQMKKAVMKAAQSLLRGHRPQAIDEGMGGAYFISAKSSASSYQRIGVFKPTDEEPCAPNNQKGLSGVTGDQSIKPGLRSGEQALREVAAFRLDHGGLAKVPPTILVSIDSKYFSASSSPSKIGSLQLFVDSDGPASDFGSSQFKVEEVQAIAALDMRLMNTDRHDGNILVSEKRSGGEKSFSLVPIDHGCCLPDSLAVSSFEWCFIDWPQLRRPITSSVRSMILNVDVGADSRLLQELGIREECIRTMRLATTFLQTCVRECPTMTLADIAGLMSRYSFEDVSILEGLWLQSFTRAENDPAVAEQNFAADVSIYLGAHWAKWQ